MRQRVISDNVANADTPNFKRSEVVFEELLTKQMGTGQETKLNGRRTDTKHMVIGAPSEQPLAAVVREDRTLMNNNKNNVDIDREMSLLAKNQLRYNFYVQQINHDVTMMRTAIEGRG